MSNLLERRCTELPPGTLPLTDTQVAEYLSQIDGWSITHGRLTKTFRFKNYYETLAFLNASALVSHREDHHPDLTVGYNTLTFSYATHSIGGLSVNDFICAAKVDRVYNS